MALKATIVWIAGLATLVPWGVWYLLCRAPREQYALLITLILFWVFGYWGVVGPVLMAVKVRAVFRAIERAGAKGELAQALRSDAARDVAIDLIASENRIPRLLAAKVYRLLVHRLAGSAPRAGAVAPDDVGTPSA